MSTASRLLEDSYRRTDRAMLPLLWLLFIVGLGMAPLYNRWGEATTAGLLAAGIPTLLILWRPGRLSTRLAVACGLMVLAALHIHLASGQTEVHFGIFVLLSLLLAYRDWRTILCAALVIAVHHLSFNYLQQWGYGTLCFTEPSLGMVLLHAAYVVVQAAALGWLAWKMERAAVAAEELARLSAHIGREPGMFDLRFGGLSMASGLGRSFKTTMDAVHRTMSEVRSTASALSAASHHMMQDNLQLDERARTQAESLARGAHLVVGTPGRIQDHLARGSLDLSGLNTLVLDEADRMVDMGFYDDIVAIASHCPPRRQTLLFSATYPDNIRKLAARFLRNPAEVKVETQHDASRIEQIFYEIDERDRLDAVARLLAHFRPASTLAFCNTKIRSHDLVERLQAEGISAQALNGDLEQRERDEILIQFANQSCAVLVATDVAARGLDIQNLGAVINVDVTKDTEVHVHRIGRSGRGEQKGLALSLCSPDEMRWANLIEQYQGAPLVWADIKSLRPKADRPLRAPMITLCIQGGKKDKLRPGDLLGALTGDGGLAFEQVGKINIGEFASYVALDRQIAKQAFSRLSNSNIKGRRFRMRFLEAF